MNNYVAHTSSEVSWCEKNYETSAHIVEYYNAISSLTILLAGIIGYVYVKKSATYMTLAFVGLSSFYFHATLSLLGQLLDELSISLLLMLVILKMYNGANKLLYVIYLFFVIQIAIQIFYPFFNRFVLFAYAIPIFYKIKDLSTSKNYNAITAVSTLFVISVICWLFDFLCNDNINFLNVQFHALWHCLVAVMAFFAIRLLENK